MSTSPTSNTGWVCRLTDSWNPPQNSPVGSHPLTSVDYVRVFVPLRCWSSKMMELGVFSGSGQRSEQPGGPGEQLCGCPAESSPTILNSWREASRMSFRSKGHFFVVLSSIDCMFKLSPALQTVERPILIYSKLPSICEPLYHQDHFELLV